MIDAHTVQFRLKFDFILFIYNSFNFYEFKNKKHLFSIDVIDDVAEKLSKNLANVLNLCSFLTRIYIEFNENK